MAIEEVDLRPLCRNSGKLQCVVHRRTEDYREVLWIKLGEASLRKSNRDNGVYDLIARMDAVDVEHDSAYAIVLPLIGVSFEFIADHATFLTAWVNPATPDDFAVPQTGYDPTTHEDAFRCGIKGHSHFIVPGGFYTPPFDRELFEAVRGQRVNIQFFPVRKPR